VVLALDTVDSLILFNLHLHLRLPALLATLLDWATGTIVALSSLGLLRGSLGLLARSRLVHATGRSSGDPRALERVPASAEGAGVLVAELEDDLVDVELRRECGVS
jgi:hypothetical protein